MVSSKNFKTALLVLAFACVGWSFFDDPKFSDAEKNYWVFQPVRKPAAPTVTNRVWIKSPIDAFILKELEAKQLVPSAPADKTTLIRRATFDLTGLPPAPAEVAAFLTDKSPKAFERVIDRLLAPPHYGEKWARHWPDVVWGGEFGRTPFNEKGDGRDHNPWGFTMWMAGAGIKGGQIIGLTDDIGLKAIEKRAHVHDIHATILHLLGLNHLRTTFRHNGRNERLTINDGELIRELVS
jgi:hypothetical protein